MEKILDKFIAKLDRKLSEARQAIPYEEAVTGMFTFGNAIVRYVFRERGCELEIYNPKLDYFLDNVALACEKRVIRWHNALKASHSNEWDDHGFRNEQDYINYKYG